LILPRGIWTGHHKLPERSVAMDAPARRSAVVSACSSNAQGYQEAAMFATARDKNTAWLQEGRRGKRVDEASDTGDDPWTERQIRIRQQFAHRQAHRWRSAVTTCADLLVILSARNAAAGGEFTGRPLAAIRRSRLGQSNVRGLRRGSPLADEFLLALGFAGLRYETRERTDSTAERVLEIVAIAVWVMIILCAFVMGRHLAGHGARADRATEERVHTSCCSRPLAGNSTGLMAAAGPSANRSWGNNHVRVFIVIAINMFAMVSGG
jgi:hypothetical protein